MWSNAREIAAGDLVIVWLTREDLQPLVVTPGKEFNGRFGVYRHSDLVGIPYGSKVGSRNGRGFIHVLRPTPELWTMSLPHRTQILYVADIAFIVSYLNIKRGSKVIEAGTGSGSFSHSVARTIGEDGHLYSYEFHEARANKARDEFNRHGMSDIVTLTHRNVCKDGFTVVDKADCVFLDLPAPWDAVQHSKKALRKDRATRICCFSPCMEQVLRTVATLNEAEFSDITMFETLLRPHDVQQLPALPTVGEVSEKLKQSMAKREDKRLKQVAASQLRRAQKRKREGGETGGESLAAKEQGAKEDHVENATSRTDAKKPRTEGDVATAHNASIDSKRDVPLSSTSKGDNPSRLVDGDERMDLDADQLLPIIVQEPQSPPNTQQQQSKIVVSKITQEVRGHTSYLTFATLEPSVQLCCEAPAADGAPSDSLAERGEENSRTALSI